MTDRSRVRLEELQQHYERLTESFVRASDGAAAAAALEQLLRVSERIRRLRGDAAARAAPGAHPGGERAQVSAPPRPKAPPPIPGPAGTSAATEAKAETLQGTAPFTDIPDIYTPGIRQWMERQRELAASAAPPSEPPAAPRQTPTVERPSSRDTSPPRSEEIQTELLRSLLQRLDEHGRILLRIEGRLDAVFRESDRAREIADLRGALERQRQHVVTLARALEQVVLRLARQDR